MPEEPISSALAMPRGARRTDFERSGEAEQARAASSGPEVANVGKCSVFEPGRAGPSQAEASEALEHPKAPAEM